MDLPDVEVPGEELPGESPSDETLPASRPYPPGAPLPPTVLSAAVLSPTMRDEAEIREQYEFLAEQLEDEEMNHEGVRKMFTFYKRALGWVLEEEHM